MRTFKVKITPAPYELIIDAENLPAAVDLAREYADRDIATYTSNKTRIDAVEKPLTKKQLAQFDEMWGKLDYDKQRSALKQLGIDEITRLSIGFALQELEEHGLLSHFKRCVIEAF